MMCSGLSSALERNNTMTQYPVQVSGLETPLITGILEKPYFLIHFQLGIISKKKKNVLC